MNNGKMREEEREIAERCVKSIGHILNLIDKLHADMNELLYKYEWDVGAWDVAKAGLTLGKEGMSIVAAIGEEDGWWKEEAK